MIEKRGMETKLIGQIHDSMIADVPITELRKFLTIVEHVTSIGLAGRYRWLTVPMVIEYEACPPGEPWYFKKEFEFMNGAFVIDGAPETSTRSFLEEFCK